MKILFIARHFTYFRNFESVVRLLAERGHVIHLVAEQEEALGGRRLVDRLAAEHPNVTLGFVPARRDPEWFTVATMLRRTLDYFRYIDPRYDAAPKIRQRAEERTPRVATLLSRLPAPRLIGRIVDALEDGVPTDPAIDEFFANHRPDVVLLTPLIELGTPQLDFLKSAIASRTRTALCVWSWDHLTSKALIRPVPDGVLVWNETQRREAIELHHVPPGRIVVTGAQCFDQWFDREPSRSRNEFCRLVGLPSDRPFVLYVCSALFRGSPSEAGFVLRWIEGLQRAAGGPLRDAAILVRPHPQRLHEWANIDISSFPNVALWGSNPVDPQSRADYFDSLFHSAAVVGLNTSALIEAAIVDRPVYTVLLPEFGENQEGTFHFRYLLNATKGFLHVARSVEEHVEQLADALSGRFDDRNRRFVEDFIRPAGLTRPATPIFVEAVEQLAIVPRQARADRAWVVWRYPMRGLGLAIKRASRTMLGSWLMADPRDAEKIRARAAFLKERAAQLAEKEAARRSAARAKAVRRRAKQHARRIRTLASRVFPGLAVRAAAAAAGGSHQEDRRAKEQARLTTELARRAKERARAERLRRKRRQQRVVRLKMMAKRLLGSLVPDRQL